MSLYKILLKYSWFGGSQGDGVVKNPPTNARDAGDTGLILGSGRSPGGGSGQHTLVILPGKTHGQRSLAGYSPWDGKESDKTERLSVHIVDLQCCDSCIPFLKCNCFTMLYSFLLYNEVNQLYVYIYLLPLGPLSHHPHHPTPLGFQWAPSWAPCDIHPQ